MTIFKNNIKIIIINCIYKINKYKFFLINIVNHINFKITFNAKFFFINDEIKKNY